MMSQGKDNCGNWTLWKVHLQMKLSCTVHHLSSVVSIMNCIFFHLLKENRELFAIVHLKEQNALTMRCMVVDQGMLSEKVKRFSSVPSCSFRGVVQL